MTGQAGAMMRELRKSWTLHPVMAILDCQLDCIWNELESGNGEHTWAGRHALGLGHTPSAGSLSKDDGGRKASFLFRPACPGLASTFTPSRALEPTSLGFQHTQQTS